MNILRYGILSQSSSTGSTPLVLDADYQAVLTAAAGSTLPSRSQKEKENTAMVALKAAGLFDKAVLGYMFKTDGDATYATYNWANPASYQAQRINSPTFTPNVGFTSNGTSSYMNTGWNYNTGTYDNIISVAARPAVEPTSNSNQALFGLGHPNAGTQRTISLNPLDGGSVYYSICDAIPVSEPISHSPSLARMIIRRTSSGSKGLSINGSTFSSQSSSSAAMGIIKILYLLAMNDFGGSAEMDAVRFCTAGLSYCWVFDEALSDAEAATFDAIMEDYVS